MVPITILVSSFDGFSDCWKPFCHGINKYWPDCPYPIFMITNFKDIDDDRIVALKIGEDKGWSGGMIKALEQINTTYILYFQEDYWISRPVDSTLIQGYAEIMDRKGLNYLRLMSFPNPDYDFPDDHRLGILATEAPYRTSLQISLWRKEVLQELLDPYESAWDFEIKGTIRSRKFADTFLSTKPSGGGYYAPFYYGIYYVCTAVNKGRWMRAAIRYARGEKLDVDFSKRLKETWWEEFIRSSKIGETTGILARKIGETVGILVYRLKMTRNPALFMQKVLQRLRFKDFSE